MSLGRFKPQLTIGFISIYAFALLPMPKAHATYMDPIISRPNLKPIAQLVMPELSPQATLESILYPVTSNLPNLYAWGNCTAYVASRLPVPSDWGNAYTWGTRAAAQGYEVSAVPRVGSIAWSVSDSYLGHVALVESVVGGVVTVSEMNFNGLGVVDTRIANPGEFRYIYL